MHIVDLIIFAVYFVAMLGVGVFFMLRNRDGEDYFVGGRQMGALHIGLSVVATDVGGGFSIGLGGLGFAMGLSGSWMLFTGLIGAWSSAVILIPRLKRNPAFAKALTFPDFFRTFFGPRAALLAGVISAIGYVGFTSSQILAGAKLASNTFVDLDQDTALLVMGIIAVAYTVMGGLKAVIYTDTIQWLVLMVGLIFIGLPVSYFAVGGYEAIASTLEPPMLAMNNLEWTTAVNWAVTIVPIWFIGMTLYQRIYACADERTAKRAWLVAGLFEWPIMAFMGCLLGLLSRVALEQGAFTELLGTADPALVDPEIGLPLLLRTVLPVGLMGLMMSAYFSAILSTADSCLMASSGNLVSDIIGHFKKLDPSRRSFMLLSQGMTLTLGVAALLLASVMTSVLDLMLYSYAFMVSGLFVPVLVGLFARRRSSPAAVAAMLVGGSLTVGLEVADVALPLGLDPNIFGIAASAATYFTGAALHRTAGE
jgi:solute:Na+ symporter, SSS family